MNYAKQASSNLFVEPRLRNSWRNYLSAALCFKEELEQHVGAIRAAEVLFERTSSAWDSAPSRETRERVAAPLTRGSATGRGVNEPGRRREDDTNLVTALRGVDQGNRESWGNERGVGATERDGETGPRVVAYSATGKGWWNEGMRPLSARDWHDGGPGLAVARSLAFGQTVDHYDESQQTYVPISFDWQSGGDVRLNCSSEHTSALHVGQTPAVMQQFGVQRLTPRECERLQGFPDDFTAVGGMSDSARYRMLGNAVAVPVAEWIGRRIAEVENGRT